MAPLKEKEQIQRIEHDVYVSIKEHFEAILEERDRLRAQEIAAIRAAVEKAGTANDRRLDLLNEFRAQAADESKKYALRETVDTLATQISRLYGGLAVVGLIGIANLVKLFLS